MSGAESRPETSFVVIIPAMLNVKPPNWRNGNGQSNNHDNHMVGGGREQAYEALRNSHLFSSHDEQCSLNRRSTQRLHAKETPE